jgi:hypothetical protein
MAPRPPEVKSPRGKGKGQYCAVHIWCCPTSVATSASSPAALSLPLRAEAVGSLPAGRWWVFYAYAAFYLFVDAVLLAGMIRLFRVRWRVAD